MKPTDPCILTINGGSSGIKFAAFQIRTDEDPMIARSVFNMLETGAGSGNS
ncbi:MAG: hypothetical protein ABSE42_19910 [Bryobacteraceae bacterium]|jgi:acetate kinase